MLQVNGQCTMPTHRMPGNADTLLVDRQRSRQSREKSRQAGTHEQEEIRYRQHRLPWLLLMITWIGIALYFILAQQ